jgi:hypothetical protein
MPNLKIFSGYSRPAVCKKAAPYLMEDERE